VLTFKLHKIVGWLGNYSDSASTETMRRL